MLPSTSQAGTAAGSRGVRPTHHSTLLLLLGAVLGAVDPIVSIWEKYLQSFLMPGRAAGQYRVAYHYQKERLQAV